MIRKARIEDLRAERNGAWVCFRDLCTRSGKVNKETVDSAKAAANTETVKKVMADHPIATLAVAAAGAALTAKLIKKLPLRSIGATALTIGARFAVMRVLSNTFPEHDQGAPQQPPPPEPVDPRVPDPGPV